MKIRELFLPWIAEKTLDSLDYLSSTLTFTRINQSKIALDINSCSTCLFMSFTLGRLLSSATKSRHQLLNCRAVDNTSHVRGCSQKRFCALPGDNDGRLVTSNVPGPSNPFFASLLLPFMRPSIRLYCSYSCQPAKVKPRCV